MKTIVKMKKRTLMTLCILSGLVFLSLMVSGCVSKDDPEPIHEPQLTDIDWDNVISNISVNERIYTDAKAQFESLVDSGKLILKLSGVHPEDVIEMEVTSTRGQDGNILFRGEQYENCIRHLRMEGIYKPNKSDSSKNSKVDIRINYTLPNVPKNVSYDIYFDENSGFCYHELYGTYRKESSGAKSNSELCGFICKKINSELAKDLQYISFSFYQHGIMYISFKTKADYSYSRSFQYWKSNMDHEGGITYYIVDSEDFYEFIQGGLTKGNSVVNGRPTADFEPIRPQKSFARIYIDENNGNLKRGITILDNFHTDIFHHFSNSSYYQWTDYDKTCFSQMVKVADYAAVNGPWDRIAMFGTYSWAFGELW